MQALKKNFQILSCAALTLRFVKECSICRYGHFSIIYAGIVNFKFKDYKAAVEDLSACVEVDDQNKSALTYLVRTQDLTIALDHEFDQLISKQLCRVKSLT